MSRTRVLAVLAGSAVGLGVTTASGQTVGADQESAYRAEVRADAAGRTSLLRDDLMGEGAMFQSGSASLDIGGQIQARYFLNFRDEPAVAEEDDFANGFELSRTKIWFEGDLNEDWSYRVSGDFGNENRNGGDSGDFTLEDAYADWNLNDNSFLRIGQFKGPFTREDQIDAKHLQTFERSTVNELFSAIRVQGIMFGYEDDQFGAYASFNDGARTANTGYLSSAEADYALTGRLEWIFAGTRDQLQDFAGWRGQDYAGLVGGAIHWQSGGDTAATGGTTIDGDILAVTVDAQVEGDGWNAFAAFNWTNVDLDGFDETDDFGFVVQGGIFLQEQLEAFGRWDIVVPDDDGSADDPFNTFTFGVNYYDIPESHASKFTVGVLFSIDETTDTRPIADSIDLLSHTGLLPDAGDPQWAIIFQYQLLF